MVVKSVEPVRPAPPPIPADLLTRAGREAAQRMAPLEHGRRALRRFDRHADIAFGAIEQSLRNLQLQDPDRIWLVENLRLLRTAERESKRLAHSVREYPVVKDAGSEEAAPRAYAVAHALLDAASNRFSAEILPPFLAGFQEIRELQMGEIWALKPMLQLALLERVAAKRDAIPLLIESLRTVGEADWKDLFEKTNVIDTVLRRDPVRAYARMDYDSREMYRKTVAELASHSNLSEREIAESAVRLAADSFALHNATSRAAERRAHIGYYLVDRGAQRLRQEIAYHAPWREKLRRLVLESPNAFYLLGIEIGTFLIVVAVLSVLDTLTPILAALILLILPATQAAADFINHLVSWLVPPRQLPKLDFSKGIPKDCSTMVAVPTLLLNDSNVRDLIADLEIRYLANKDPNLYFALLTDWPDAPEETAEKDHVVHVCIQLIEQLNARYGTGAKTPFYLFHRHRVYNPKEGIWMGWERKRGKLLDLNQFLRGAYDSFPIKVGNPEVFPRIRYVITLDSDTQLPRDSAQKLVGAIAHPLNRAVIDPHTAMVVEGYGILQPRIGISIQSVARSRLANIYSGQTGFDIYTRAVSDVYQDLFGEGIFTGKGIYEVDTLRAVLERRFPDNRLLSHDLIEGAYARAALVSDLELIDDYPSHFSAYSRRRHRWVRGDWQILRWVLPQVPSADSRYIPNPVNLISRWKILDNARRSLFDPATLVLLLAGWLFLPGGARHWTGASVVLLLMPVYADLLFSILRMPLGRGFGAWFLETAQAFAKGHFIVLLQIAFLLQQALLSLDAILRSLLRTMVTKRRLLEWETAAESESAVRKSAVDRYLKWSPAISAALAGAIGWLRPDALPVAAPILFLWFSSWSISRWLNRPPRAEVSVMTRKEERMLRCAALRTWRFFREYCTERNNWLIPDNVRETAGSAVERISPTNLGFLLNANVAAVRLGYLTVPEFAQRTRRTLDTMLRMPRFRGHFRNWHDNLDLRPLDPPFVSTVDSGNLLACLWTLRQAALAWIADPPPSLTTEAICEMVALIAAEDPAYQPWVQHAREPEWLEQQLLQTPESESAEVNWWLGELRARLHALRTAGQDVRADLRWIAETIDRLSREMDFSFLYDERKKVLRIGYDTAQDRRAQAAYDLLASESRIAAFVAIAKGDIPQEAWFHLGRKQTIFAGQRVLVSWTGTMFEYLMPRLWMYHEKDTLLERSARAVVEVQSKMGRKKKVPWGISESACGRDASCEYGYSAFGIPELAMKHIEEDSLVISPYSSFLALQVDARAAVKNIKRMAALGWTGPYGFIEAVDFGTGGDPHPIRMWMAHHQGMTLLSILNLLCGDPLPRDFHSDPQVLATQLLLHERVPRGIPVEKDRDVTIPHAAALVSSSAA